MHRFLSCIIALCLPVYASAQSSLTYQNTTGLTIRSAIPTNSTTGTYFGLNTYPLQGNIALPSGHTNINCNTRGWNLGTTCLGVVANYPLDSLGQLHQGGGTGGIWNVNSQVPAGSYLGQDSSAFQVTNQSLIPVAIAQPVSSYSLLNVVNFNGQTQQIWKVTFSTALTSAQIAQIVPSMRLQTSDGFAGYTIPQGLLCNGNALPLVGPNGTYLYSDRFDNGNGGGPYSPAPAGATIIIDQDQLVEDAYSNWKIQDGDTSNAAITWEAAMLNDHVAEPTWSVYDPFADKPYNTAGFYVYGQADNGQGVGTIGTGFLASQSATGTEKRGFSARNAPVGSSGPTTGFDCPFPTVCFKSEQITNSAFYVLLHQSGGTGSPLSLIDTSGNAAFLGQLSGGTVIGNGLIWANVTSGIAFAAGPSGNYRFQVDALSGSEQRGNSSSHQIYDSYLSVVTTSISAAVLTRNGAAESASNAAVVFSLMGSSTQKAIYSVEAAITCSDDSGDGALWNAKQLYTVANTAASATAAGSTTGLAPITTTGTTTGWNIGLSVDNTVGSPTVYFTGAANVSCTATAPVQQAV